MVVSTGRNASKLPALGQSLLARDARGDKDVSEAGTAVGAA